MSKMLVTLVAHRVIERNPANYLVEERNSVEQMDQVDIEAYRDDPFLFIDDAQVKVDVHITHLDETPNASTE